MGSMCGGPPQPCPEHPSQHIDTICLHPRCIEPLCPQCVQDHRAKHQQLGTPPVLKPLSDVTKQMQKSFQREAGMYEQLSDFNQSAKRVSTASMIKQYTREYFLKKRGASKDGVTVVQAVRNLQQAQGLTNNLEAKHMFNAFIKSKVKLNNSVVEQSQKDLY